MEENLMNANTSKTEKIKTHHARIVVGGTAEKPCYSIEWFDPVRKEYFLGYSSYFIENVFNWLSECFEIVEATKTNADRIRAMSDEEQKDFILAVHLGYSPWCDYHCAIKGDDGCDRCIEKWLQQPADQ